MPVETLNQTVQAVAQEIPTWFVCAMGMGIVFIGLICLIVLPIILLVMLMVDSISFGSSYMVEDILWHLSPDYWF